MDILYIIGKGRRGSNLNDEELKYSLRSIAKFGENIGRVFIVGYLPKFINTETVTHIETGDPYNSKHKNIMHKIDYAIQFSDIGEKFLISSDDHFYVKPVDFEDYPIYYKGIIPSKPKTTTSDRGYYKSLVDTKAVLLARGMTTFATNPHCNTMVTRKAWHALKPVWNAAMLFDHGLEVNCVLGNWYHDIGYPLTKIRDIKIGELNPPGIQNVIDHIGDAECFSLNDKGWNSGAKEYLQQLFPEKCIYEK